MKPKNPELQNPDSRAEDALTQMFNKWGIDLYADLPDGWEVVDEFVAPYYFNPDNKEDGQFGVHFDGFYGQGFWGVKLVSGHNGEPQYHLVDIIARKNSDDPTMPAEDDLTAIMDAVSENAEPIRAGIPKQDIIKRVPLTRADGTDTEIILVKGQGMSDKAAGEVVELTLITGGMSPEVKSDAEN